MGFLIDTITGISWRASFRGLSRLMVLVKTAILARILTPSQFGVYGIAILVLGLLEMATETGINVFLVQEDDDIETFLNSAWVASILRGTLIAIIILLSSSLIVSFFNNSDVKPILYLVSLVAFVRGFINPMEAIYQKKIEFKKQFFFLTSLFLIDSVVAISYGIYFKSESAFVVGMLAAAITEVVITFIIFKSKPKFVFEIEKIKKVLNSGKWLTLAGFFNYLFQNLDNLIVGKFLGFTALGYYQQAYKISTLPTTEIADVVGQVTFPIYVKIKNNTKKLLKSFILITSGIAVLSIGLGLVIYFYTPQIVTILLGDLWLPSVPVLKVLTIFAVIRSITGSPSSLYLALKKQKYLTVYTFVSFLGLALTIIPLINKYGLIGVGYSVVFGCLLSVPFTFYFLYKIFLYEEN